MWDVEHDVVVIGSGFAGLAAAIEAREAGADVVVLEKMRNPGGNSIVSGGLVAAPGSHEQRVAGIEDSPACLLEDMLEAGQGLNDPDLAALVADNACDAHRWTRDHIGVEYRAGINHIGGHSVPRTFATALPAGVAIVRPLLARCRELGISILQKTCLVDLVADEAGRVTGVVARENYLFPQADSGRERRIGARRGVILAAGGFGADIPFRCLQDPRLDDGVETTNQQGATSEVLRVALAHGATPVHLSWIQLGPWASDDEKGWGVGSLFSILAGFPYGIMVDAVTGRRFVNELSDRKLRVDAMLAKDRNPIAVVDAVGVEHASTLDQCLKRGVVRAYDTVEDLARAAGMPAGALAATVKRYNQAFEQGIDEEYGKPLLHGLKPLVHPPFYAIRLTPKVHHCMGGLRVDTRARVLHVMTDEPIAGLYAAGEITGGVHGASRLGSCAIPDCLVFGRIAGAEAARALL